MWQSQCITKLQLGNFFLRNEKLFLLFYTPPPNPPKKNLNKQETGITWPDFFPTSPPPHPHQVFLWLLANRMK